MWSWLKGKKTIIGAVITVISTLAGLIPTLTAFGVEAALVGQIVGIATMVVGVLHKFYRYVYGEDHD